MCRLRKAAIECNYKEVDRQLKEHFIHMLNDSEMLTEIIRELTNGDENIMIPSNNVLIWAKRIEAKRALAAVINSLNYDAIQQKDRAKQRETKLATPVKMPVVRRCKCCSQLHKLR